MIKVNFGHTNAQLAQMGFTDLQLQADLSQPIDVLAAKIADLMISNFPNLDGQDSVQICLPGASILAAACLVACHGILGVFPQVVTVLRDSNGAFVPQNACDMQAARTAIRSSRNNVVII